MNVLFWNRFIRTFSPQNLNKFTFQSLFRSINWQPLTYEWRVKMYSLRKFVRKFSCNLWEKSVLLLRLLHCLPNSEHQSAQTILPDWAHAGHPDRGRKETGKRNLCFSGSRKIQIQNPFFFWRRHFKSQLFHSWNTLRFVHLAAGKHAQPESGNYSISC